MFIILFEDKKTKKILLFTAPMIFLIVLVNVLNTYLLKETLFSLDILSSSENTPFFRRYFGSLLTPDILGKSIVALKAPALQNGEGIIFPSIPLFLRLSELQKRPAKRQILPIFYPPFPAVAHSIIFFLCQNSGPLAPIYGLFILPAFIFVCSGIERIVFFLQSGATGENRRPADLLIRRDPVLATPSILIPRTPDKMVYKTAGEYIAKLEETTIQSPWHRTPG